MLSPKQLYYYYTTSPCSNGASDFLGRPELDVGGGTPYDLPRLANFLKQLKYPCYGKAPHTQIEHDPTARSGTPPYSGILDSGKHKLGLPYRVLLKIDVEAFSEIQQDFRTGTAMAVRNAVDIARACETDINQDYLAGAQNFELGWEHRTAYEYMTFFGGNQLTNCLMMLGPDLIDEGDAIRRGTGCGDLDCLPRFATDIPGSALGATFSCFLNKTSNEVDCTPCRDRRGELNCEDVPNIDQTVTITIANPAVIIKPNHGLKEGDIVQFQTNGSLPIGIVAERNYYVLSASLTSSQFLISSEPKKKIGSQIKEGPPIKTSGTQSGIHTLIVLTSTKDILTKCCGASSCEDKMNFCCGDVTGDRGGTWTFSSTYSQGYPIISTKDFPLMHGGILKRKSYAGYVNLINSTGSKLYSCPGDLLLRYIQKHNDYNYDTNTTNIPSKTTTPIQRIKTISLIYNNSPEKITSSIKDLLYNGYGVVMMTNVGFPNQRDSRGLSFPDRIWYHSFTIIGYDDRKKDYENCVFLLANSWGKWNDGGHPVWGPIPDGSFLVTEYHLQCMLNLYRTDRTGCRGKYQPPDQETGGAGSILPDWEYDACVDDSSCVPWGCAKHQRAMGLAFALSTTDGFPRQRINYQQFYRSPHRFDDSDTEYKYIGDI